MQFIEESNCEKKSKLLKLITLFLHEGVVLNVSLAFLDPLWTEKVFVVSYESLEHLNRHCTSATEQRLKVKRIDIPSGRG
jgi:hypothetical protein